MKEFNRVVSEIRWAVAQVMIIPALLSGIIVFLAVYIVLEYFDFYPWIAFFPAIATITYFAMKELAIDKLKLVERYYPSLNEKLRTAADYADKSGIMVDDLHKEVIGDVKDVATSAFISKKDLFTKVIACVMLSFILLSITHFQLDSSFIKDKLREKIAQATDKILLEQGKSIFNQSISEMSGSGAGVGINNNIFGKQNLAKLGTEELEVKINPANVEFKIGKVEDAEKKDFEEVFPSEIYLEQTRSYEEKIPKEQQELVKNYFKKITEDESKQEETQD